MFGQQPGRVQGQTLLRVVQGSVPGVAWQQPGLGVQHQQLVAAGMAARVRCRTGVGQMHLMVGEVLLHHAAEAKLPSYTMLFVCSAECNGSTPIVNPMSSNW